MKDCANTENVANPPIFDRLLRQKMFSMPYVMWQKIFLEFVGFYHLRGESPVVRLITTW